MTQRDATHVVLVGAGHVHVQVLESWAKRPPAGARLTLVVDRGDSTYSGMVPGFVAGDYRLEETSIPVAPLARRAGAQLLLQPARRIDPARKFLETGGGDVVHYDIASLDVGAGVRGLELPGVREHALATRPIGEFASRLDRRLEELAQRRRAGVRIAVVGGGAAGVELAFTLHARLAAGRLSPQVFVVCGSDGFLSGYGPRVHRLVTKEARRRGISIAGTSNVVSVDESGVGFETGRLLADLVVWATGAAPPRLLSDSVLPRDKRGFVRVAATLEVAGQHALFAAGDCATIDGEEWVPKAGVHAVREAPVLDANLRATLRGEPLRCYRPQRDFLTLLNLGGRRALATKWGLAAAGHWAWLWKDRIDRRFVERFRHAHSHDD